MRFKDTYQLYHQILEGVIHTIIALQPIVNLQTMRSIGYEALTRWQDFSPEGVFTLAVKYKSVDVLESLIVKEIQAIRNLVPGTLFVNVHPTITNPNLWQVFCSSNVVLEMTEAERINWRGVRQLRDMGFRLALDDLGTGHSTFEALLKLRPDYLKLDKVLIQAAHVNARDSLLASMVEHAQRSGSEVIVEGIETEEQLKAAQKTGCHLGQGFLLGKPKLCLREQLDGSIMRSR